MVLETIKQIELHGESRLNLWKKNLKIRSVTDCLYYSKNLLSAFSGIPLIKHKNEPPTSAQRACRQLSVVPGLVNTAWAAAIG